MGNEEQVARMLIRKCETNQDSALMVGERVLIEGDDDTWYQGSILNTLEGNKYKVQNFYLDGYNLGYSTVVDRESLTRQMEPIGETTRTTFNIIDERGIGKYND